MAAIVVTLGFPYQAMDTSLAEPVGVSINARQQAATGLADIPNGSSLLAVLCQAADDFQEIANQGCEPSFAALLACTLLGLTPGSTELVGLSAVVADQFRAVTGLRRT